ncbi:MAG: HEAT repeat domain-containing protein [Planctomycetes bacterium]|nr:HEAT repeat domain-containing protein [Planctomycetota bacterium]
MRPLLSLPGVGLAAYLVFTASAPARATDPPAQAPSPVQVEIRRLQSPDPATRWAAADALGAVGAEAVPALLEALRSDRREVRQASLWAVSRMEPIPATAFPALVQALDDPSSDVREEAGKAVVRTRIESMEHLAPLLLYFARGQELRDLNWRDQNGYVRAEHRRLGALLVQAFKDRDPRIRRGATHLIVCERFWDPAAPAGLRALLADPVVQVRSMAVLGLSALKVRSPETISAIASLLDDAESCVRFHAARALEELAPVGTEATRSLLRALKDPSTLVRRAAARALGVSPPAHSPAGPVLAAVLADEAERRGVRAAAAEALAGYGEVGVPALEAALRGPSDGLRRAAVASLGRIGPPARAALPALREAVSARVTACSTAALEAIGLIGPEQCDLAAIARALQASEERLCRAALVAAGGVGADALPLVPHMIAALQSKDEVNEVASAAARALSRVGPGAQPALIAALRGTDHTSIRARIPCLLLRGETCDAEAVAAVIEALGDRSARVRAAAAGALGRPTPQAGEWLSALIRLLTDPDAPVRKAAVRALGDIGLGEPRVLRALIEIAASPQSPKVERADAVDALGCIGPAAAEALPAILAAYQETGVDACLSALRQIDASGGLVAPLLIEKLQRTTGWRRAVWIDPLAEVGPPARAAVPLLRRMAEGADEESAGNRSDAIRALGAIAPDAEGMPDFFLALLRDPSLSVGIRAEAAWALEQVRAKPEAAARELERVLADPGEDELLRYWVAAGKVRSGRSGPLEHQVLERGLLEADARRSPGMVYAISRIGPSAADLVPALMRSLEGLRGSPGFSPNRHLDALGRIGPAAAPAVPLLLNLLDEAGVEGAAWQRDAICQALRRIRGEP